MAVDDLPWNTTRCNRLLRPLSSKLAKLRKELEQPRTSDGERRASANAFALRASPRKAALFSQPNARRPAGLEKRNDPDWMPNAGAAAATKKTYGGKGMKTAARTQRARLNGSSARPGEIAFTPLVARTAGRFQESPQFQGSPLKRHSINKGPLIARAKQIQELKKQMPTDIGNLVKGMSEAYANLLKATTTGEEKRWKGTRSLFGACLRRMPEYIELEEYFAALDKEEEDHEETHDLDISQEIYTHLEAQFESVPGQGWRAFKQIVRAHGTSLLCDAFADQLLGVETLHLLVSHCVNALAWDEAEKLLWSFIPNVKPMLMPNTLLANLFDEQRSLYMWMTNEFVIRTGRHRHLYELLEYMISQELLPLEWLATECMRPMWDRLVRTLSDGDHRLLDSAFRFLETAMFAGIGLPDESLFDKGDIDIVARQFKPSSRLEFCQALDTTFSSLFTVLTTIALVNRNREETLGEQTMRRVTWVLDSIVVGLLKRKDIPNDLKLLGPIAENLQTFAARAISIVFASFVVHLEGCGLSPVLLSIDIPTTASAISWVAAQYSSEHVEVSAALANLPGFISSAARGTGRIWKDDGFDQMQRLVHNLLSLTGVRLPHKLWTLKRLALEAVMEFAQSTGDVRHMAYARDIESTMRTKGHVVIAHSPQKNDSSSSGGFRWEEGIGEWVACTPFAKQDARPVPRKPLRALELLPTPENSRENSDAEEILQFPAEDVCEAAMPDNDDDYTFPQSSPVKRDRRLSTSSIFKKPTARAPSPIVLISTKRNTMTPSDTQVLFFPQLPEETCNDDGVRKSRRTRTQINALVNTLRHNRSRTSLDKGLRLQERKTYEEPKDLNIDLELLSIDGDSDCDPNTSFSSSSSIDGELRYAPRHNTRQTRTRSSLPNSKAYDSPFSSPRAVIIEKSRSSEPIRRRSTRSSLGKRTRNSIFENEERDELNSSKTPQVKRRKSARMVQKAREWWRVDSSIAAEVESNGESEDELSFQ